MEPLLSNEAREPAMSLKYLQIDLEINWKAGWQAEVAPANPFLETAPALTFQGAQIPVVLALHIPQSGVRRLKCALNLLAQSTTCRR